MCGAPPEISPWSRLHNRSAPRERAAPRAARLSPERLAAAARAHRAIETSRHWVLDVTFDRDRARNRRDYGPENLAILRLTLNLLNRGRPTMSVRRKRKRSGWSDALARMIIGQTRCPRPRLQGNRVSPLVTSG
jgi:hypothetical protein